MAKKATTTAAASTPPAASGGLDLPDDDVPAAGSDITTDNIEDVLKGVDYSGIDSLKVGKVDGIVKETDLMEGHQPADNAALKIIGERLAAVELKLDQLAPLLNSASNIENMLSNLAQTIVNSGENTIAATSKTVLAGVSPVFTEIKEAIAKIKVAAPTASAPAQAATTTTTTSTPAPVEGINDKAVRDLTEALTRARASGKAYTIAKLADFFANQLAREGNPVPAASIDKWARAQGWVDAAGNLIPA